MGRKDDPRGMIGSMVGPKKKAEPRRALPLVDHVGVACEKSVATISVALPYWLSCHIDTEIAPEVLVFILAIEIALTGVYVSNIIFVFPEIFSWVIHG
jgi:hypothetical protein